MFYCSSTTAPVHFVIFHITHNLCIISESTLLRDYAIEYITSKMAVVPVKEEQFIEEEEEDDEHEEDDLTTTDQEEDPVVSSLLCQICGVFVSSEYSILRSHFEALHRLTVDKILKDPHKFVKLPKPESDIEDSPEDTLLPLATVLLNLEKKHGKSHTKEEENKTYKRQNAISADDFFFSNRKRQRMVIETVSKKGVSADPLNVRDTDLDDSEEARIFSEESNNPVELEGSAAQNTASSDSQINLGDRRSFADPLQLEDNCDIDIKEEFVESETKDINTDFLRPKKSQ